MAGVAKVGITVDVTGIGEEVHIATGKVTVDVPTEHGGSGRYIIHATGGGSGTAIQLTELFPQLTMAQVYGVYIKAEVGTIYIMLNTSGTTAFPSTTADLRLGVGESAYIPTNYDITTANGMTIDSAANTDAFTITAFQKTA